ncbi:unnamed protein product, partial [Brassica rapa subsp. narinosa]
TEEEEEGNQPTSIIYQHKHSLLLNTSQPNLMRLDVEVKPRGEVHSCCHRLLLLLLHCGHHGTAATIFATQSSPYLVAQYPWTILL